MKKFDSFSTTWRIPIQNEQALATVAWDQEPAVLRAHNVSVVEIHKL